MAWYDTLGKMAKNTWDFTGIPGLFHDVSNSLSNSDPWYVDVLNGVKDTTNIATAPLRGAVKGILATGQASYELGGKARQAIEKGILDTPFMYNKFKNQDETYDDYLKRVEANKDKISMGQATLSLLSPGKNAGPRSGWLQEWEDTHLKFLANGFDVFNPEHRKAAFQDETLGKWFSGVQDLSYSSAIDPLTLAGFVGKGVNIAAKGMMYTEVTGKAARAVFGKLAMTPEKLGITLDEAAKAQVVDGVLQGTGKGIEDINFLARSDAKTQYKYWTDKKVTNPDAMAEIFGRADTPEKVINTYKAVLLQDKKALSQIFTEDPVNALAIDNMSEMPHVQRLKVTGKLDSDIVTTDHSPEYISAVGDYITDMAKTDERFASAMKDVMTGNQIKYGFESGYLKGKTVARAEKAAAETFSGEPSVSFFQKSTLHPLVKVVNYFTQEVPSGKFSVNDANSYAEVNAFLREANQLSNGTFAEKAAGYADRYLTAMTPGDRFNIILQAEKDAITHIFPNWSESEIEKIYAIYDSRRATAIKKMKDQGFISTIEGDRVVHNIDVPILGRESANFVVTADLRKLKRAIDAHETVLPGILEGLDVEQGALRWRRTIAGLDTINDIFKTSVLLRLGYTVRNNAEAALSLAAKGFALPAIAATGGKAAMDRFFKNRKVGFTRLADNLKVMTGRQSSVNSLQLQLAQFADNIQSVEKSTKSLAKEIYRVAQEINANPDSIVNAYIDAEKAKGNLVGREEVERLAIAQELRKIAPALAELDSVTGYHGSLDSKFKFDGNNPLALSTTRNIADRYATPEYTLSLEDYLSKVDKNGTPLSLDKMIKEPRFKVQSQKLGTASVFEHMPQEEWTEVQGYVNGEFMKVQKYFHRTEDTAESDYAWDALKDRVPHLEQAIERSRLSESTTLYRAIDSDTYFNAQVGDTFIDKGFLSTSKSKTRAEMMAKNTANSCFIEYYAPRGSKALDINSLYRANSGSAFDNMFSSEQEVLLGRNLRMKVTDIQHYGNMAHVKVTIINEAQPKAVLNKTAIKAIENMKRDMILAKRAGHKVLIRHADSQTFFSPSERTILDYDPEKLRRAVVKVRNENGTIATHTAYGRPLSLVNWKELPTTPKGEVSPLFSKWDALEDKSFLTGNNWKRPRFAPDAITGMTDEGQIARNVQPETPGVKIDSSTQGFYENVPSNVQALFDYDPKKFKQWIEEKGWQNKQDPIYNFMRENGYGRLTVPESIGPSVEGAPYSTLTHIVLPEYIGEAGKKKSIEDYVRSLMASKPTEAETADTALTRKERKALNRKATKVSRVGYKVKPVSPYYTQDTINSMLNNGIDDAASTLKGMLNQHYAAWDDVNAQLGSAVLRAEQNSVKHRVGYGNMEFEVNGHKYVVPKAYEGASWLMNRVSAESTWNSFVGSHEMAFTAGMGSRSVRLIKAGDPRYFEGWANILNMHFRDPETGIMDPVVRMILDKKGDDSILNWFKTKDGMRYADDTYTQVGQGISLTKLKAGELDDHLLEKIQTVRNSLKLYVPDEETALMLSAAKEDGKPLSGGELQNFLRERFGKRTDLPDINGLLVTTSKEYRDQERIIDTVNRRVMRFLGSMPEDTFFRHPLANMIYERRVKQGIAAFASAKGTERLTAEEISNIQRAAREEARQEVERTLFTIVRRSGASSSTIMRLMFPFYGAYENTAKRWAGFASDDPSLVTTASRTIAQIVNGQTVVDGNGNRITDANQLQGNHNANLIVRVPQGFINSLPAGFRDVANNAFKQIQIPLGSLDVITQVQPGNPGFGPFAVLPAYAILQQRPELEDAFKPFFPAGQPQSAMDLFAPSVLRRLRSMWTQDALYVRTYDQMLRYETYNYNTGQRDKEPTAQEIQDKTNKFFILRALASVTMPVAISPEADFYAQQYRKFQQMYPDTVDPTTGKLLRGQADAKFLEVYPDFFGATVSLSKNMGGIEPSLGTVANLRKFSNLMAFAEGKGDPELMGFLADDGDGKYTFSQAAYQWQYSHGAYPGSKNTYRQNRAPGELVRDANIKQGWVQFGSLMDQIEVYKTQNGIESDKDPQMTALNKAKQLWVQSMRDNNPDWYAAYVSPDKGKYMRRVEILEQALSDKKWLAQNGNRPVVKSVKVYLDVRSQLQDMLLARKQAGGSSSLDANSNGDIAFVFDKIRTQLALESPEFSSFMYRYFPNDPVVV
jgi:hypothetical protein